MLNSRLCAVAASAIAAIALSAAGQTAPSQTAKPLYPDYPSETPARLQPVTGSFDYTRRVVIDSHARRVVCTP